MTNVIDRLARQRTRFLLAKDPRKTKEWFIAQIEKLSANRPELIRDRRRYGKLSIGEMFFFAYDPKTKQSLPYYDKFPLIFPVEAYEDGFLGINLHYLPPNQRALLLDKLMETATNTEFDETTKLQISHGLLASTKKYRAYKPCLKRYLSDHMRSKFIKIDASEWDIALFLPYQDFEKRSSTYVWKESMDMF